MSQLKAYPEYKDSDIEWLSDIPENWEIKKIKHAIKNLNYRRIPLSADYRGKMTKKTYDYYGASGIIDKVDDYLFNETLILVGEDGANLYSRSTPLAFLASGKYWVNNHAHIMKPKKGNIIYYVNLLETIDYTLYITGSAQPKLTQDAISNIWLPVPPIFEQEKIADFIKEKASEIDNLISDKERLIELLKEKRQAVITETVTKGLDPNVEMKDSGIEWIGEIPKHWKTTKIKYTTYVKGRIGWQGLRSDEFIDIGPHLVTGVDFQKGLVNWSICHRISEERYKEAPEIQLKNNDVLITKDGTIGKIAIVKNKPKKAILNSGVFVTRSIRGEYLTDYIYWILNSNIFINYMNIMSSGTTVRHLYQETFNNFIYPLPNIDEQRRVSDLILKQTNHLNQLIDDLKLQISKLKEYRESLIYEAVTGKIDVRDYATETEEVY